MATTVRSRGTAACQACGTSITGTYREIVRFAKAHAHGESTEPYTAAELLEFFGNADDDEPWPGP
jgi:hypothetical protein